MAAVPLPNPALIPNPAYLVVGAYPDDKPHGRKFWDNPHYYFFDQMGVKSTTPPERVKRYIQGTFESGAIFFNMFWNPKLIEQGKLNYIKKFDVVIFDHSVVKFLGNRATNVLNAFLGSVKDGGKLILINLHPVAMIGLGESRKPIEEKFIKDIESLGFPFRIVSIAESVAENEVAAEVYGLHEELKDKGASREVVIIDKPGRNNAAAPPVAAAAVAVAAAPAGGAGGSSSAIPNSSETPESNLIKLNRLLGSLPELIKEDDFIQAIKAEVASINADFKTDPSSITEYNDRIIQLIESINSFMSGGARRRKSRRRKLSRKTRRQQRKKRI